MSRSLTGWAFVAAQAGLLLALVVLPGRHDWPLPGWLAVVSTALVIAGLAIIVLASLRLGPALTATPVPSRRGSLVTSGLFGLVRHPIYTGVLTAVLGVALRSRSVVVAGVAVATVVFFNVKAAWEERRLVERYPGYARYAATTPRFVPRPRR